MKTVIAVLIAVSILSAIPSFPGAEGWGAATPGGRGGKIYVVTTTASTGTGSLRAALQATGPRIIVFRVSGVIDLQPGPIIGQPWEFNTANSNVTIAGQTSPGGITLVGSAQGSTPIWHYWEPAGCQGQPSCQRWFHDAVFRFLRFRAQSNNEHGGELAYAHNFIFDHCDFSGGGDECTDFCHDSTFTMQWCTMANSSVCNGCQTYGTLIGYNPTCRISLHHNFWAHHIYRSPDIHWLDNLTLPFNGLIDYRNNVIYDVNIPVWILPEGPPLLTPLHMNMVSNYYKAGPQGLAGSSPWKITGDAVLYSSGNTPTEATNASVPWDMPAVTTTSSSQAYDDVLAKIGAWPRDAMNTRTINECKNGTGQLGKTDDALITTGPAAPADADLDGMPDFWETAMGLNPSDSTDQRMDKDGDGYTNVEEYINDLALARLCEDYHNPVYPIPNNWPDYNPSCCKSLAIEAGNTVAMTLPLNIRPNPYSGGVIRINAPVPGGKLSLLGMDGKIIATWPVAKNGIITDFKSAPGIYIFRYSAAGKTYVRRVAVIR